MRSPRRPLRLASPRRLRGRSVMTLHVESEIGRLRTVLVHEPGREIDRMVPSMMQDLLFDDILFGARAREEHRRFRQILKFVADEVLEARDLLEEVLQDADARNAVLTELATLLAWPPAVARRPERPAGRPPRGRPRRGDRAPAAGDHGLARLSLPPAAPSELVLPARPGRRPRRPRDPERDGDARPLARAAPLGGDLRVPSAFRPAVRRVLVPRVRRRGEEPVARAHAADARGRRRPRDVGRDARDRLLGAHREDHDRAPRRGPPEGRVGREAHPRGRDPAAARDDAPRHDLHAALRRGVPLPRRR